MSKLTSLLARDAIVPIDVIEEALQREVLEGGEIDTALLELGVVDENVLASYRAAAFELEPATRDDLMQAPSDALERLPADAAERLKVVPLSFSEGRMELGAAEPPEDGGLAELARTLQLELTVRIGTEVRVAAALHAHYDVEPSRRLRRLADTLDDTGAGTPVQVQPSEPVPSAQLSEAMPPPPRLPPEAPGVTGNIAPPGDATASDSAPVQVAPVQVAPVVALGSLNPDRGGEPAASPAGAAAKGPALDDGDTKPARPSKLPAPAVSQSPVTLSKVPTRSQSPSPRPRHVSMVPRGPVTRGSTTERLQQARGRDEVLDVLFAFARQYFECTVLFSVREGHLLGMEASGLGAGADPTAVDVAFAREGAVHDVVLSQIPKVTNLARLRVDAPIVEAIGRLAAQPAALVPVTIRRRVVAVLYGDRDGLPFEVAELADLVEVLPEVTRAFERIIQEHKVLVMQTRRRRSDAPSSSQAPDGSSSPSRPPPSASGPAARGETRSGVAPRAAGPASAPAGGPSPPAEPRSGTSAPTGRSAADPEPRAATPPRARRAASFSRADDPFRRSQIGERLTRDALSSLGVRGSAPAPPAAADDAPNTTDEELERRPTVQLSTTHVLESKRPSKPAPGAGSYSQHDELSKRRRRDRDVARASRPPSSTADPVPETAAGSESRPPPGTLSQPPPGAGSYAVSAVDSERVSLPSPDGRRRPSRPTEARRPGERVAPRNSERPPGPPPRTQEERAGTHAEAPKGEAPAAGTTAARDAKATRTDDSNRPASGRKTRAARERAAKSNRPDPRRDDDGAPESEQVSVPPEVGESLRPPQTDETEAESLAIDMDSEADRIVEELARCAPGDEAPQVAALLRLGEPALEALTRHFPGGLWFDRSQAHQRLPAGRDVSGIARALHAFEDRAATHIARLLSSPRADVRLYAILLAAERVYSELMWPLYERVYDDDGGVRLLMYETLPLYRNVDGFDEVLDRLRERALDDTQPVTTRLAALEAIAVLRDPLSLGLLLTLSQHQSKQLSIPASRALVMLTGQDFAGSARKWRNWISKNAGKHRVEWLIDSLMHPEERIREQAGNELQKLSQVYYGYSPDAPKRERDKAKRRYQAWWNGQGKKVFGSRA